MYYSEMLQKIAKLREQETVNILAIETSCDETSAAVIQNGRKILSNIVSTQIDIHKRFGGVVPEVASRNHVLSMLPVIDEALNAANLSKNQLNAIAVTQGAGLVGALLVGLSTAKALSFALNIPLIAVNHIKGHIAANYLAFPDLNPPFICLITSGGHTAIVEVDDYTHFKLIGQTCDDAIGEAFDKVARVLGLEYPGGVKIDKISQGVTPTINFIQHDELKNSYSVSYSGLKTAVINYVHSMQQKGQELNIADICASFQRKAVDMLAEKAIRACKEFGKNKLVMAGGVAANSELRNTLQALCDANNIELFYPPLNLCTDNAAMIGSIAYYEMLKNPPADLDIPALPNIEL